MIVEPRCAVKLPYEIRTVHVIEGIILWDYQLCVSTAMHGLFVILGLFASSIANYALNVWQKQTL